VCVEGERETGRERASERDREMLRVRVHARGYLEMMFI
jgi:hypothetical protein